MVNADKFFSGNYLNVETLKELNLINKTLIIMGTTTEIINDKEKLQIIFEGVEEGFIPNKTNYLKIKEVLTSDTDNWKGKKIVLDITKVMFNGKLTPSILIKEVKE